MGVRYLDRPGGRLAHEVRGDGPLVVCAPGLGDLRGTFTDLVDRLVARGHRVAWLDLRGHGESSTGWDSHHETDIAEDLLALVAHLGGPAVLVGNSYSAGAAVIAAARAPEAVSGLVLTGPFVRDQPVTALDRLANALFAVPWLGRALWCAYWPNLFGDKPADLAERKRALAANLAEPGRFAAVLDMLRGDHAVAEAALTAVRCPAVVVMGERDPDFADPAAEARFAADALGGTAVMVAGAGHYPHAERPDTVAAAVAGLRGSLDRSTCRE